MAPSRLTPYHLYSLYLRTYKYVLTLCALVGIPHSSGLLYSTYHVLVYLAVYHMVTSHIVGGICAGTESARRHL